MKKQPKIEGLCPRCKIFHIHIKCPKMAEEKEQYEPQMRYMEEESILQEADKIVHGQRQWAYDHPLDNFTKIGEFWGTILEREAIPPETVGLMCIAIKMARQMHRPKRDNMVDAAGYAAATQMALDEQVRRNERTE